MVHLTKENPSIISKSMNIVGNIQAENGIVEIEGTVKGDINAHTITIREQGNVEGNLKTKVLNIKGTFVGKIISNKLNISDTAVIKGSAEYEFLSVDYGADMTCEFKRFKTSDQTKIPFFNVKNKDIVKNEFVITEEEGKKLEPEGKEEPINNENKKNKK